MKKEIALAALTLALAACSSSTESEEDNAEVYSSYGCLSAETIGSTVPDELYQIPNSVIEIFKPTQEEDSELVRDTIDLKTTTTDYRLVLRNSSAELEVNTRAQMKAMELCRKRSWYMFKAGVYQEDGVNKFEVKEDGIYLIANGKRIVVLANFCLTQSVSNEILSEKNYTNQFKTTARGQASTDVFMVSKADTTYRCRRISAKRIQLDMVSPREDGCTILKKE